MSISAKEIYLSQHASSLIYIPCTSSIKAILQPWFCFFFPEFINLITDPRKILETGVANVLDQEKKG